VIPTMIDQGGGKIINQASGGAFKPSGVYGVSKYGVVHLAAALASELGQYKINVNTIAPGSVETDAGFRSAPVDSAFRKMLQETVPLPPSAPRPSCLDPSSCWHRQQKIG